VVALREVHANDECVAAVRPDLPFKFLEPLSVAPPEGDVGALASERSRGGAVGTGATEYHDGLTGQRHAHRLSAVFRASDPARRRRTVPKTR
jgi:hypothetical protein